MKKFRCIAIAAAIFISSFALAESNQKAFDAIKSLNGTWTGKDTKGKELTVTFRETANGSALLSEIHGMEAEDMVSMIHMDNGRLLLTHYCGIGNQPRMAATLSPDGKSVAFNFVDATNLANADAGHMREVVFGMPDANHHTEEWTFVDHGKEMKETFTLERSR
jgi:hypothetical protein